MKKKWSSDMMRSWINITASALVTGLFLIFAPCSYADMGAINGRIQFEAENAMVVSAEWTRVYLVKEKVPVPEPDIPHGLINYTRVDRINSAHQKFYTRLQRRLSDPGFFVASTLAAVDGSFRFTKLDEGRYFVVVAFPSLIGGYKVAWQSPVDIGDGQTASVELNRHNMALPTFSRSYGTVVVEAGM